MKFQKKSFEERVSALARIVTEYCTDIKEGDNVFINASPVAAPLVKEIYKRTLIMGGHPFLKIGLPGLSRILYEYGSDKQITYVDPFQFTEAKALDVRISIASETNLKTNANVDPRKLTLQSKEGKMLRKIMKTKNRWNVTIFPTDAYAQEAEMSTDEFTDFVFESVFADAPDPVKEWKKFNDAHYKWQKAMQGTKEVRIVCEGTDLRMSTKGRKYIISSGTYNMPSGELFTGPVEDSVNGHITFSFPALINGKQIEGVEIDFKDGKAVRIKAKKNEDYLLKMIDMDKNARFVGELGIGTNYQIQRFTNNILFDEKIGGTVHIALGASYPETGGKNVSALHLDIITDLRQGGELIFDGKVLQRDGKFIV